MRIGFIKKAYNPYLERVVGRYKYEKSYLRTHPDCLRYRLQIKEISAIEETIINASAPDVVLSPTS